jgi:aminoglycoside phosphotransferase (APT) family kinase protein
VTDADAQPMAAAAARDLERHLADHAGAYFPDLGGESARVCLRREYPRAYSTLYEFEVVGAHGRHAVIVKLPAAAGDPAWSPGGRDRPRRATPLDPRRKSEAEFRALAMIHEAFTPLADPRFGTVAPLDFLHAHRALVMEKVAEPRLSALLLRGSRLHRSAQGVAETALRNTGAWLATYHRLGGPARTRVRHGTRAEFEGYVSELTAYLSRYVRDRALLERVRTRVLAAAAEELPAELPMGMSHGDFAPRNVLVAPDGRVTVIDTLARWHAPVYDDIGEFLSALRAPKAQAYAQGRLLAPDVVAAWEDAFLGGYFGAAPRPMRALRLFEAQAALERLASVRRASEARGGGGPADRLRTSLTARFLCLWLDRLAEAVDQP